MSVIQADHPNIINKISTELHVFRAAGIPLSIPIIRGIMLGLIRSLAPSLLSDGKFKVSASYIRHFMKHYFAWSYCVGTCSAQKTPANWEELGHNMAIRIAMSIRTYGTPPELIINGDQTGIHLLPSPNRTWAPTGDQQVSIVGQDDKRQITAMVTTTASGHMLPTQMICAGRTERSLPALHLRTGVANILHYDFSGGDKHWSNMKMMKAVCFFLASWNTSRS